MVKLVLLAFCVFFGGPAFAEAPSLNFKNITTDWNGIGGITVSPFNEGHKEGKSSIKFFGSSPVGHWDLANTNPIKVKGGRKYTLTAWVKVLNYTEWQKPPFINVNFFKNGKYVSGSMTTHYEMKAVKTWQLLKVAFVLPNEVNEVKIGVSKGTKDLGLDAEVLVSDVQLK